MNTFSQRIQKYHNSLLISSPVANGAIDLPYSFCTFEIHSHILYFVFPVNTVWTVLKFSLSFGILSISAHVCVCIHSVWHSIGWMNRHLFSTFYWQMDISVAVTLFPVVNLSEHPCICPLVNMRHLLLIQVLPALPAFWFWVHKWCLLACVRFPGCGQKVQEQVRRFAL